jgi:tetratricopeptide (TPR) repeat protein
MRCSWVLAIVSLCAAVANPQAREADRLSPGYKAYQQANSLFTTKRFPESLAAVDEALRLDPMLVPALTLKAKMAMTMNRYDIAQENLERALAAEPGSTYAQFLYGFQFYLANDLQRAVPELKKARQLNPADPRAALYLGLASESLGQTNEALSLYEEAVRLDRAAGNPQAGTFLVGARLLLLMGRLEDCERWIRQALKADPNSRDCHYEFARLLLKKGDAVQAAAEGEAALRLANGDIADNQIHYLLIRAYGSDRPADAERHAEAVRRAEKTAP